MYYIVATCSTWSRGLPQMSGQPAHDSAAGELRRPVLPPTHTASTAGSVRVTCPALRGKLGCPSAAPCPGSSPGARPKCSPGRNMPRHVLDRRGRNVVTFIDDGEPVRRGDLGDVVATSQGREHRNVDDTAVFGPSPTCWPALANRWRTWARPPSPVLARRPQASNVVAGTIGPNVAKVTLTLSKGTVAEATVTHGASPAPARAHSSRPSPHRCPGCCSPVVQAVRALNVGRSTAYNLIATGDRKTVCVRRLRRVPIEAHPHLYQRAPPAGLEAGIVQRFPVGFAMVPGRASLTSR